MKSRSIHSQVEMHVSWIMEECVFFQLCVQGFKSAHSLVRPSPAPGSRTSSTANRTAAGNSCRSDGSAAQPDLRVTSRRLLSPSPATASHPGPHLLLAPPPCGQSSRRTGSRRRYRSAGPSPPGRRPSPGPDLLLHLWAEACSVDTEDMGSTPGGRRGEEVWEDTNPQSV